METLQRNDWNAAERIHFVTSLMVLILSCPENYSTIRELGVEKLVQVVMGGIFQSATDTTLLDINSRLVSSILPLLFKVAASESADALQTICGQVWDQITRTEFMSSVQLLRTVSGIIVHLFDHFFGITGNAVKAPSGANKLQSSPKKRSKVNRKDAKDGIVTGGGVESTEHHDLTDWSSSTVVNTVKDLRSETSFWILIQSGLVCGDPITEKYALFLLKRVVDFSKNSGLVIPDNELFSTWDVSRSPNLWNDYFVVLDILQESSGHLIEPILPKLSLFLNSDCMHATWWITLMKRGIQNNSAPMRKRILEYLISSPVDLVLVVETLCSDIGREFLLKTLIPALDSSYLYHVSGLGSFVSLFGEKVRAFIRTVLEITRTKSATLREIIKTSVGFSTKVSVLYVMMGLSDFAKIQNDAKLGPEDILHFSDMITNHRAVSVWTKPDARKLFCQLAQDVMIAFSDRALFSFNDVSQILTVIGPSNTSSSRFEHTRNWCSVGFGSEVVAEGKWLLREVQNAVANYLKSSTESIETDARHAEQIGTMVTFISCQAVKESLQPLLSRLHRFNASLSYAPSGLSNRVILLVAVIINKLPSVVETYFPSDTILELIQTCQNQLLHPSTLSFHILRKVSFVFEHVLHVGIHSGLKNPSILVPLELNAISKLKSKPQTQTCLFVSYLVLQNFYNLSKPGTSQSTHCAESISLLLSDMTFSKEAIMFDADSKDPIPWSDIQNEIQIAQHEALESALEYAASSGTQMRDVLPLVIVTAGEKISNMSNTSAPLLLKSVQKALDSVFLLYPAFDLDTLGSLEANLCVLLNEGFRVVMENSGNAKHFHALLEAFCRVAFSPFILHAISVGEMGELRDCVFTVELF
ncbi:hypothetical protein BDR26DRAFT_899277 [Obelidium mucronatum]|nr:hypothetical protein BDR26DRAFT_899277 [Obelidium mucronatum]